MAPNIDTYVSKFLQWRLPASVSSDLCVTDRTYEEKYPGLRSGTNLLTADEARQMFDYLLAGETPPEASGEGWEWAVVEVFGHRKHAGRTREEERFGAKLLRVDIPNKGDSAQFGWTTVYYGGSSIFSFSLSDEATVIRLNKPYEPASRLSYRPAESVSDDIEDDDPV